MARLNTMFNPQVNPMCTNNVFTRAIMPGMHESAERLYQTANEHGDASPAKVARRLNISPQRLQNWEQRGVSLEGAMAAQAIYHSDANWIIHGTTTHEDQRRSSSRVAEPSYGYLTDDEREMIDIYRGMTSQRRAVWATTGRALAQPPLDETGEPSSG